jgi:hypothetical protein
VWQLVYLHNNGDTWLSRMMTDRIPMLFGIAALCFGFVASSWVGTTSALALDYLSRVYLREPTDEIQAVREFAK